jgi:hypothetical protein
MLKPSTSFSRGSNVRLGHGSNVQGLETTSTYIPGSDEFEINSPTLTVSIPCFSSYTRLRNGGLGVWE